MDNKFIPLDCDDDIILISTDSFTVSRLKELVIKGIKQKTPLSIDNKYSVGTGTFISHFHNFKIYDQNISIDDIQFSMIKQCQVLKIGSKGWQTGKIKIRMSISPITKYKDYVELEFCPDEPEAQESPLDDIRKLIQQAES